MISHDLIVTTYNSYKYLDSLYQFANKNINKYEKIIIIDDCSNIDFFKKLLFKLNKFEKVLIQKNKSNLGPSASRNIGITLSKAEYISFHDPDDYVCDERFDIISYFINKYKPKVLFHDFTTAKLKNRISNNFKYKFHNGFIYLFKSLYVTPAFTCRRELLEQVGGYNNNIRFAEDLDLYIRLRNISKFMFVNQKLVKISNKSERVRNSDHLSSDIKSMRKSMNKIFIAFIFPINWKSFIFVLALINNIFKSFID